MLPSSSNWNWAAPSVGDIDGDGAPEIVVNTLNGVVWAWNADGTEVRDGDANPATTGVFYKRAGAEFEWSRSGPTLFDLDGDDALDIIFGTKNDSSGLKRVMAIRYDGTERGRIPVHRERQRSAPTWSWATWTTTARRTSCSTRTPARSTPCGPTAPTTRATRRLRA
jgi:hypothetical protein